MTTMDVFDWECSRTRTSRCAVDSALRTVRPIECIVFCFRSEWRMATGKIRLYVLCEEFLTDDIGSYDDFNLQVVMAALLSARENRNRIENYCETVVSSYRVDEFKTFFRLSRQTFEKLCESISATAAEHYIEGISIRNFGGGRSQLPVEIKLLMTVWYLTGQETYSRIADRFGVSESTACTGTRKMLKVIHQFLLQTFVVWPNRNERTEISDLFEETKGFPGVKGMIDGTHIAISTPRERPNDYYNRKQFHSVVLQAVVREDMRFTDLYCGWPGKVHDARIFANSPLYENGRQLCDEGYILGDGAYPLLRWLLTPFRDTGHLTPNQKRYNTVHSSIRCTVERAFGLLKGRFRRLQGKIDQVDIADINHTIMAACILHNMCILQEDEIEDFYAAPEDLPQVAYANANIHLNNDNSRAEGAFQRMQIIGRLH